MEWGGGSRSAHPHPPPAPSTPPLTLVSLNGSNAAAPPAAADPSLARSLVIAAAISALAAHPRASPALKPSLSSHGAPL